MGLSTGHFEAMVGVFVSGMSERVHLTLIL